MAEVRKIVRVFLASPGDLTDERIAVSDVVAEINDNWADFLGYQIELMGWEDTVSRHRRPQEVINQDLDRCELFIGMMWKKWGTPPDTNGEFSSGFEEEYTRAVSRKTDSGLPEISMFFKKIPDHFMEDKGPDLIKVLDFRQGLIDGKEQLFQEFGEPSELTTIVRKCLTQYLVEIKNRDNLEAASRASDKQSEQPSREDGGGRSKEVTSPFSEEGFEFLNDFVKKVQDKDTYAKLTACEVARFRLLACSISRSGNDDRYIEVHDQNILYVNRSDLNLSNLEIISLAKAGFRQLASENAPLWFWYALGKGEGYARYFSVYGDSDAEKQGAIQVLDWTGATFGTDGPLSKQIVLNNWFGDDSSSNVRNMAIKYLSNHGDAGDIETIKSEYDRNERQTARTSLEGLILLTARTSGSKDAALLAISKQFDAINEDALSEAVTGFDDIESADLRRALSHRNAEIRLNAVRELDSRGDLSDEEIANLLKDDSAETRYEALRISIDRGATYDDEGVREVLVRPKTRTGLGFSMPAPTDEDGEKYYDRFELERLSKKRAKALEKLVGVAHFQDDNPYFALTEKYFGKWGNDLRGNVDDEFVDYFEERIRRFQKLDPEGKLTEKAIESLRRLEVTLRKQLVRQGADILCRKGDKRDLKRIRRIIKSDFVGGSDSELEYMGRFGGWSDIEALANLDPELVSKNTLAILRNPRFLSTKAKTIYKLGRKDPARLMQLNMPPIVKNRVLQNFSDATFVKLKDQSLIELFNDPSDQIRKTVSLLAVRSLTNKRIKALLDAYLSSDSGHYYNVIHWLDLGVSMPRAESKAIVNLAISQ